MFTQPLVTPINDKEFVLIDDYVYEFYEGRRKFRIVVPKGFVTDLASIPRWVWSLVGLLPDGLHRAAAVIHDWLYQRRGRPPIGSIQEYVWEQWVPAKEFRFYYKGNQVSEAQLDKLLLKYSNSPKDFEQREEDKTYDREGCDLKFAEAMADAGCVPWKRKVMFSAVRLFGGKAFDA